MFNSSPFHTSPVLGLTRRSHPGLHSLARKRTLGGAAVSPLQPSRSSLKFVVPPGQPLAQWPLSIDGGAAYMLNGPQPWWVGGDKRQRASAGGFVRVFG